MRLTNQKITAKMFESNKLEELLSVVDPLLGESDRFKQRGAAEILAGLLRGECQLSLLLSRLLPHPAAPGSKHWPKRLSSKLWSWTTSRLDRVFAQIKPDTLVFWESVFSVSVVLHFVWDFVSYRSSRNS
jgi:proteasome activator subunit 4